MNQHINEYQKKEHSFLLWLDYKIKQDSRYQVVREAFDFAKPYHSGFRKDNATPEFQHHIEIALDLVKFNKQLSFPTEILATVFLHDVVEDYGVDDEIWGKKLLRLKDLPPVSIEGIYQKFGLTIGLNVAALSKKIDGVKKGKNAYFRDIKNSSIASIVKLADRKDNLNGMLTVFSLSKQENYVREVKEQFIKVIDKANQLFPEQGMVYDYYHNEFRKVMLIVKNKLEDTNKKEESIKRFKM